MNSPRISFEFFPPQTLDASFRLWETVQALAPMAPEFVSVTYGAGGTTRRLTHEAVTTIQNNYRLNVAAHLTCVDATRAETLAIAESYAAAGVSEIVALRGDAPKGASGDSLADVRWLKRKIDAGASSAITQFFFEAETFLRFRDLCAKEGITAPIIPGILPITGWEGARKFAQRCGTHVPAALDEAFRAARRDGREELLSVALCAELCDELLSEGVEDLHFYTLNRPHLTREVCRALGFGREVLLEKVA
jgi:methylenetetrahydrofolate reductase (NADPH)